MAGLSKSRWADTENDAELEAQQKKEREEKKRAKAEKARKAEAERLAREAEAKLTAVRQQQTQDEADGPPAKRRRLSPLAETAAEGRREMMTTAQSKSAGNRLLRFEGFGFGPARSVENYEKLNDIDEGAYGWVARAQERATGRVVALKRLKIDPGDRMGLPVTGLREIDILRNCDHRNIVKIRNVVVGDDTRKIENIFIVLEFVEHDLRGILEDMPEPFLASEVKTLLRQLAEGVAYLHDNWILHRDLKTSNLLLNNRGQLKIADFGMSRYVGDPPPKNLTTLVVTLWYRAPELLLGARTYGRGIDMWSVGCIFAELLTHEPLLQGRNEVEQLSKIFDLCGTPTDESWPGFRRLPNVRLLRLPKAVDTGPDWAIRRRFPLLTAAGVALLSGLLSLDPARRPSAKDVLAHEYFRQDPRPKQEAMFPTFPSKAGQERRHRRQTPDAPARGQAVDLGALDFSGVFAGRGKEEKGGGFNLRVA